MKCSLIDIGSNSIRQVFYNISQNKFSSFFSKKNSLGLLNYIENHTLSQTGINLLIDCLSNMCLLSNMLKCDKNICFSTASLRYVNNCQQIKAEIYDHLNLSIDTLSSEKEIFYDFLSLKAQNISNCIGSDLGGGSCQIFISNNKRLGNNISLPIGCLNIYKTYINGFLASKKECLEISKYITSLLNNYEFIKNKDHYYKDLYLIGGSGRAICKLHKKIISNNVAVSNNIYPYKIKPKHLSIILESLINMKFDSLELLNKILPSRVHTIIPAIITINCIANISDVKNIYITNYGVREGYLIKNILKN